MKLSDRSIDIGHEDEWELDVLFGRVVTGVVVDVEQSCVVSRKRSSLAASLPTEV